MRKQHLTRRLLSLLLTCVMMLTSAPQALAAESAQATTMQLKKTEGTVAITNNSGRNVSVRENLRLYNGYHLDTEEASYAWIDLDKVKLVKMDAVTEIGIRKSGKLLDILVDSGNLFFNVTEPLAEEESLTIRTATMVVGIRGTSGWVKVIDQWTTQLFILEGTVEVTVIDPVTNETITETVSAGETVICTVYPQDRPGTKCAILRQKFTAGDVEGFVLADVLPDAGLCEKIYAESGIDLRGAGLSASDRLAADQAAVREKLAEIEDRFQQQEHNISRDPVWTNPVAEGGTATPTTPAAPNRPSGGNGGGADIPTPPPDTSDVVTLVMPQTAATVNDYLSRAYVRQVILVPSYTRGVTLSSTSVDILSDPSRDTDPNTPGDGIPDEYQVTINFAAVNGTVSFSETVVTKIDADGAPAANGAAVLAQSHIPTTTANTGFTGGTWDTTPVAGETVVNDGDTFTITYERRVNTITVEVVNGTASASSVYVLYGEDSQPIRFTGNDGYVLGSATVDGAPVTLDNDTYTFRNVVEDHTIRVVYVQSTFTATFVDGQTGDTIETKSDLTALPGESTYPAAPEHEGYDFTGWTIAGPDADGNYTITANYTYILIDNVNQLQVDTPLTVPSGKILTLQAGVSILVWEGETLSIQGTMTVDGEFEGEGLVTPSRNAQVKAKFFKLLELSEGWSVSETTDSEGFYSLVYTGGGMTTTRYTTTSIAYIIYSIEDTISAPDQDTARKQFLENYHLEQAQNLVIEDAADGTGYKLTYTPTTGDIATGTVVDTGDGHHYDVPSYYRVQIDPNSEFTSDDERVIKALFGNSGSTLVIDGELYVNNDYNINISDDYTVTYDIFCRDYLTAVSTAAYTVSSHRSDSSPYTDVPADAWYAEAVEYCRVNGLMTGTSSATFSPDAPLTRAMTVTVLHRLAGKPAASAPAAFTDVQPDAWYADAIAWASGEKIVLGYSPETFGVNAPVTHEQLSLIFQRYSGDPNMTAAGADTPKANATRAEVAATVMNCAVSRRPGSLASHSAIDVMCAPSGIVLDQDGSLVVTDVYSKQLWRVRDRNGTVYAGSETVRDLYGQPMGGYNDAVLLNSFFKEPWAAAPFLDGWAVSDTENDVVRLVRGNTTQTLNGATKENLKVTDMGVAFNGPTGLAADGEGNLYVSDTRSGAVRRITSKGGVTTVAKNLSEPMGLCWKDGVLYIAEAGKNRIVTLKDGKVDVLAGSGSEGLTDGSAMQAAFSAPQGVAVGNGGSVYVADTGNGAVRKIQNGRVTTLAVRDMRAAGGMVMPRGLLLQGNVLYICDPFARRIFTLAL